MLIHVDNSGNGRIKLNNSSDTTNIDLVGSNGSATFKGDLTIASKIIHDGDTNTAIRFPAADTFTVELLVVREFVYKVMVKLVLEQ